jgi:hypothetical protein
VNTLTQISTPAYICGQAVTSGTRRDVTTWRERHDEAVRKQEAAQQAYREATDERALALLDGVAELGTQTAVAAELGVKTPSVNQAIRAYQKKNP